jgi:Cyclic nucleotide-binding domain
MARRHHTTTATVPPSTFSGARTGPRALLRRRRRDTGPLRRAAAFADADPGALADLAPSADVLRLPRGLRLAEAGTTARELVVVLAGEAVAITPDGARVALGPGAEVGGRETLAGERHAATVVATSAVEVLVVDGRALRWAAAEGAVRLAPAPEAPPARHASPARREPARARAERQAQPV